MNLACLGNPLSKFQEFLHRAPKKGVGHYERGLFTGGISKISKISKFSRISRQWSDSPLFSTLLVFSRISRISRFSRISRKWTFLKDPFSKRPLFPIPTSPQRPKEWKFSRFPFWKIIFKRPISDWKFQARLKIRPLFGGELSRSGVNFSKRDWECQARLKLSSLDCQRTTQIKHTQICSLTPGQYQPYKNKNTQICTFSLGMTAAWPTPTGLCKFGCGFGNCWDWKFQARGLKSAVKQKGPGEEWGPQKSSRNVVSESGRFRVQTSLWLLWKEHSTTLALFGRRILGQHPAAPSSPGPFVFTADEKFHAPQSGLIFFNRWALRVGGAWDLPRVWRKSGKGPKAKRPFRDFSRL